jgi:hypothetical protein
VTTAGVRARINIQRTFAVACIVGCLAARDRRLVASLAPASTQTGCLIRSSS